MGEKTDKISGRAKQASGAATGDEKTKRNGERKRTGKLDSTVGKAQDVLEDPKTRPTGDERPWALAGSRI